MNQIVERRRRRREYLWQRCEAYGYILFFLGLIVAMGACLVNDARVYSHQGYRSYIILITLLGLGIGVHLGSIRRMHHTLKTMPYVPPVMREPLPAAESLVRGAAAPGHLQHDVLVRPARAVETPQDELLHLLPH